MEETNTEIRISLVNGKTHAYHHIISRLLDRTQLAQELTGMLCSNEMLDSWKIKLEKISILRPANCAALKREINVWTSSPLKIVQLPSRGRECFVSRQLRGEWGQPGWYNTTLPCVCSTPVMGLFSQSALSAPQAPLLNNHHIFKLNCGAFLSFVCAHRCFKSLLRNKTCEEQRSCHPPI